MSLLDTIKADQLAARKARDGVKASLLTTLLGDIQRLGIDSKAELTDGDILKVINKFLNGINETLGLIPDSVVAITEKLILEAYQPVQLTIDELEAAVKAAVDTLEAKTVKDLGLVMKSLKTQFDGKFDGKQATNIFKTLIGIS